MVMSRLFFDRAERWSWLIHHHGQQDEVVSSWLGACWMSHLTIMSKANLYRPRQIGVDRMPRLQFSSSNSPFE